MKRLFLPVIAVCMTAVTFAQVKIVCDNPDLEVKYKRTFVAGNTVIVDFLFTYMCDGETDFTIDNR